MSTLQVGSIDKNYTDYRKNMNDSNANAFNPR